LALAFSAQHRLQQQTRVDRHAQGHGRVDGVLKLDVYQQVTFAIRGIDLPDAIGVFLDQSVTDQVASDGAQGLKVKAIDPWIGNETANELGHHVGVSEQQFVGGIVLTGRHGALSLKSNPLIRSWIELIFWFEVM
jgi:hypothetical protein